MEFESLILKCEEITDDLEGYPKDVTGKPGSLSMGCEVLSYPRSLPSHTGSPSMGSEVLSYPRSLPSHTGSPNMGSEVLSYPRSLPSHTPMVYSPISGEPQPTSRNGQSDSIDVEKKPTSGPRRKDKDIKTTTTHCTDLESHTNETDPEPSSDEETGGFGDFGQLELTEEQRQAYHKRCFDSDEDLEDEILVDDYQPPERMTWVKGDHFVTSPKMDYEKSAGPTQITGKSDAMALFQLFFSPEIFEHIVAMTNKNRAHKVAHDPDHNKGSWTRDVTVPEMMAYYGVLIIMDIIRLDKDQMYWSSSDQHFMLGTNIPKIFSRDRFGLISKYLYFSEEPSSAESKADKLYKVRPLLDKIIPSFQKNYNLHREIAVGESIFTCNEHTACSECCSYKPVRFYVKMWVVVDSATGYCYNLDVYVGKTPKSQVTPIGGLYGQVVINLLKDVLNRGHVVFTDHYYTSPLLAAYLLSKKTFMIGTVNTKRKHFPKDLMLKRQRDMSRGEWDWRQSGELAVTCWKQDKLVYHIDTFSNLGESSVKRTKRNGEEVEYHCPPGAKAHGAHMSGLRSFDKYTHLDEKKRSMRWYRCIERKLMEASIFNAFVIEDHIREQASGNERKRDLLAFKLDLAHLLVGHWRVRRKPSGPSQPQMVRLDGVDHWPVAGEGRDHRCVVCYEKHKAYKTANPEASYAENPYKSCKTMMKCEKCEKYLCVKSQAQCFKLYHTVVDFSTLTPTS